MNRIRRQYNKIIDHFGGFGRRRRVKVTTIDTERTSFTQFESLSNEIIYEIFDFLDMYHVYEAFSNLNIRFENLLYNSTLPIKINTSYLSKTNFQRYYTQFVLPNINRINSLHLWNSFMFDLAFASRENMEKFIELKTVVLDNVIADDLLDRLISLPNLSSLIINQLDCESKGYIRCFPILCLPALKYCKVSYEGRVLFGSLFDTSNQSSPIEHLVINGKFNLNELPKLLLCVPHLRRLSIDCLYLFGHQRIKTFPTISEKLTHVSLKLERIKFNRFEPFITHLFHNLQVFRISTDKDKDYLDANRWERLILSNMILLRVFDIQHSYQVYNDSNQLIYNTLIKQFTSSFWTERQWYFAHQHHKLGNMNYGMFYSIKPYRRRYYMLYGMDDQNMYLSRGENNFRLVRHIHIRNLSVIDNSSIYFPNANELTICNSAYISHDSILTILNRILPFKQLNQIIIDCNYLDFVEVIEILHFLPNCYKLKLNSIELDEKDLVSPRNDATFRLKSSVHQIRDVTIKLTCTLEQVKLLVKFCPRLQHLTIKVLENDFTSTIKFLLPKNNNNTYHLLSLHIQSRGIIWIEKLANLVRSVLRSDKFSVEVVGYHNGYIWW